MLIFCLPITRKGSHRLHSHQPIMNRKGSFELPNGREILFSLYST